MAIEFEQNLTTHETIYRSRVSLTKFDPNFQEMVSVKYHIMQEPGGVLCAFGGPEGLTTVFGQFKGVEQDKIGGKSRNRGEHAEKRDLNRVRLYAPDKGGEFFC